MRLKSRIVDSIIEMTAKGMDLFWEGIAYGSDRSSDFIDIKKEREDFAEDDSGEDVAVFACSVRKAGPDGEGRDY